MPSNIGIRCSEACTRSGLAALILAGVALGLLPVTDEAIRINSLRQYLNLRLALVVMNYDMPQLALLTEILNNLGKSALLESARDVGPRFDHGIFRWEQFRRKTALRRLSAGGVAVLSGWEHPEQTDGDDEGFSWGKLSISDVTEIARYELPTYDVSDEMENRRQRVSIPSVPIPMDLRVGVTILLGGLLLVVVFFWLYQQEARRADTYPDRGTIFAVIQ